MSPHGEVNNAYNVGRDTDRLADARIHPRARQRPNEVAYPVPYKKLLDAFFEVCQNPNEAEILFLCSATDSGYADMVTWCKSTIH